MNVVNLPTVSSSQFYLIASAQGLDTNSIATNTLSWGNGFNASNTLPMFARLYRKSGTLSLMVATIRLNATIIQAISAASSVLLGSGADPLNFPLSSAVSATTVPISGNWDFNVTTPNGSSGTVLIEIWGMKIS